jgi:hypothetical protein
VKTEVLKIFNAGDRDGDGVRQEFSTPRHVTSRISYRIV